MTNKSGVADQIISLPKGGGELKGLGEKFQPDLYTGTGNFSIQIAIPSGRNGFQPNLTLSYSTGMGNGSCGLGWNLAIPNISRKTSKGIPRYLDKYDPNTGEPIWHDQEDIFVLAGSDDLIHVDNGFYRPRTEGSFSKIQRKNASDGKPCWIVTSKEGIKTVYGNSDESRIFFVSNGNNQVQIFQWLISEVYDTFGNKIIYTYKHDNGPHDIASSSTNVFEERNHSYNQVYLQSINYVDYKDPDNKPEKFLFKIDLDYGEFDENGNQSIGSWGVRPDRFSSYSSGFEIRTIRRCKRILIKRLDESLGNYILAKSYELQYTNDTFTNVSLLKSVTLKGYNGVNVQPFAPIIFEYTELDLTNKKFENFSSKGSSLPNMSLADPNYEIIDLFGNGLACIINSSRFGWRYWRNNGSLNLSPPQLMKNSPSGVTLEQEGVQFADMDGDGSVDLLVTDGSQRGYYSKDNFNGEWRKFYHYRQAPTFNLKDPNVKLVDVDGDGIVDILATLDHQFLLIQNEGNEKSLQFKKPIQINRKYDLDQWPNIFFDSKDKNIFLADISGDGMQDIVMIHSGRVDYWPNMGYGKFGKRITMSKSPRLEYNFDPKRIFLTDVNGDGLADLLYVDSGQVHIWINQSGNSWSSEVRIYGTPRLSSIDSVRIADMKGSGTAGILWSYDLNSSNKSRNYKFLDFTAGIKPLLLNHIINNIGADIKIEYRPSTYYYLKDLRAGKIWKTTLPFPVQVVARVEIYDYFSKGKVVTEYFYHHGYWDGKEREFRGFGRVDQRDTQYFKDYNEKSFTSVNQFNDVPLKFFSPPTETISWFHQGPIMDLSEGQVKEQDFSDEYWPEDKQVLLRTKEMNTFIDNLTNTLKHNALRTLRGNIIRTEVYALDGFEGRQQRPYSVTENLYGITSLPIDNTDIFDINNLEEWRKNVFFPHLLASRTTKWERGTDPMTNFQFTDYYDKYGQPRIKIDIAVPRRQKIDETTKVNEDPYLVTFNETTYAYSNEDNDQKYIVNRVSSITDYEIKDNRTMTVFAFKENIVKGIIDPIFKQIIGQTINYYDGQPFTGLPFGQILNGALVRTEKLVLTNEILKNAYENQIPIYLSYPVPPSTSDIYPQDYLLRLKPRAGYNYKNFKDNLTTGYIFRRKWGINGKGNGEFNRPYDIAIDQNSGNVYVTDSMNSRIQKFDRNGNFIQIIGNNSLANPTGIAVDQRNGDIYVAESTENNIKKFSSTGQFIRSWKTHPGNGQPSFYGSIAVDSDGYVYIADTNNNRIQKFTSDGQFVTTWGSFGDGMGKFRGPTGISIDKDKNIYVTDGNALQKFSSIGTPLIWQGRNYPKPAWGIALDVSANIYETYQYQKKIQKFASTDYKSVIYSWGEAGNADGQFGNGNTELGLGPYGIDINKNTGEIYIADTANNRIQVFSTVFENGYYVNSERRKYDFHDLGMEKGRGLVTAKLDELDNTTRIEYDDFKLMPEKVTDPLHLVTKAKYNYDVLQPEEVIDINENVTNYDFTPLGLLKAIYVKGKSGTNEGDVKRASKQLEYNIAAFLDSNGLQPIHVITRNYIHHDRGQISTPELDEHIKSAEYFDGFGRMVQTRTQCEYVLFDDEKYGKIRLPSDQSAPVDKSVGIEYVNIISPRVVISGFQTYDNKGRVIEKYEPFFSKGWEYEQLSAETSQKITMFYDALGRMIKSVNPDGSEQLVVYGIPSPADLKNPESFIPTPWEVYNYDLNDNAGRTSIMFPASIDPVLYQSHWNTPSNTVVDSLGRKIVSVERNGENPNEWYTTKYTYDITGNLLTVLDTLGRTVSKQVYDISGKTLRTELLDAGMRFSIFDAFGNMIEERNSNYSIILHSYDTLERPIRIWAKDKKDEPSVRLRQVLIYGDDEQSTGLTEEVAKNLNLLGKLYKHFDEAGLSSYISDPDLSQYPDPSNSKPYDFKGNVLQRIRKVISDQTLLKVFESPPSDWKVKPYTVDWQPANPQETFDTIAERILDPYEYRTSMEYDGLNRIKKILYPKDVTGSRKLLEPKYNRAGDLQNIKLGGNIYVQNIGYNAKGQITIIAFGNNVMTRYAYDEKTFRLSRMRTESYQNPTILEYKPSGKVFQDLGYEYDLSGNIMKLHDRTPKSGIPNTSLGIDKLDRTFSYSPLYRLVSATGREYKYDFSNLPAPWSDNISISDPTMTREYRQEYQYDPVGNMQKLLHTAENSGFNRLFEYVPNSNKLRSMGIRGTSYEFAYDNNGNVVKEANIRNFEWDHSNRMKSHYIQSGSSEPSLYAQYIYDSKGRRVKKIVRKQGNNNFQVTVYIDDIFEYHLIMKGAQSSRKENNTLQVMDNKKRIATVRIGEPFAEDNTPALKFNLDDHLNSSNLIIDKDGKEINREEYYPFGETSFGSFSKKRYRFTGKEKDEESGLYYHGARYYSPWLGRWISCDPAGLIDGINIYIYVRNNPIKFLDVYGLDSTETISPEPKKPWTNNIPGTQAAHDAAQYYADMVLLGEKEGGVSGFSKQVGGWTGGLLSVLWTADLALTTAITLGTAGLGAFAQAGRLGAASAPTLATLSIAGSYETGVSSVEVATGKSSGIHILNLLTGNIDSGRILSTSERTIAGITAATGWATMGYGISVEAKTTSTSLSPASLRWSQTSAGGRGRAAVLRESMGRSGYEGLPIDTVSTPEGILTIDNTRPAIALELGIPEVPATVYPPGASLPIEMIFPRGRFGPSLSWGEAAAYRTGNQRPHPLPPIGTTKPPRLQK